MTQLEVGGEKDVSASIERQALKKIHTYLRFHVLYLLCSKVY